MSSPYILGLIALLLSMAVQAQDNSQSTESWHTTQSTQSLLGVLAQRSQHTNELRGDFIQRKQLSGLPMPLIARGFYEYTENSGLRWVTQSPIESQLKITNKGISGVDNSNSTRFIADIFLAVIRGDLSQLEQYFAIQSRGNSAHWTLRLTPSTDALGNYISYINVSGAEFTEQLFIMDSNGDSTDITLIEKIARAKRAGEIISAATHTNTNIQAPLSQQNEPNRAQ